MSKHSWVKITITPIHIVSDPVVSAEPVVFISEADEVEAIECSQYGCIRCDETLTSETVDADCEVNTEDDTDFEGLIRRSSFGDDEG